MAMMNRMTWILTAGVIGLGGTAAAAPSGDGRPAPVAVVNHHDDGFDGRDGRGGFDGRGRGDHDGRGGFRPGERQIDRKLWQAGAAKIEAGESKVRLGRALVERGQRSHQRALVRKGKRMIDAGQALISAGERLQLRAAKAR